MASSLNLIRVSGSGYALLTHHFFPIRAPEFSMNHTFTVTGMTCGHCEMAVTRALKQVDPQAEVKIDRAANQVAVQSGQPREQLAQAITEEGYTVAD
jgi:copper chaperone